LADQLVALGLREQGGVDHCPPEPSSAYRARAMGSLIRGELARAMPSFAICPPPSLPGGVTLDPKLCFCALLKGLRSGRAMGLKKQPAASLPTLMGVEAMKNPGPYLDRANALARWTPASVGRIPWKKLAQLRPYASRQRGPAFPSSTRHNRPSLQLSPTRATGLQEGPKQPTPPFSVIRNRDGSLGATTHPTLNFGPSGNGVMCPERGRFLAQQTSATTFTGQKPGVPTNFGPVARGGPTRIAAGAKTAPLSSMAAHVCVARTDRGRGHSWATGRPRVGKKPAFITIVLVQCCLNVGLEPTGLQKTWGASAVGHPSRIPPSQASGPDQGFRATSRPQAPKQPAVAGKNLGPTSCQAITGRGLWGPHSV